jgi:hypothetical protein
VSKWWDGQAKIVFSSILGVEPSGIRAGEPKIELHQVETLSNRSELHDGAVDGSGSLLVWSRLGHDDAVDGSGSLLSWLGLSHDDAVDGSSALLSGLGLGREGVRGHVEKSG